MWTRASLTGHRSRPRGNTSQGWQQLTKPHEETSKMQRRRFVQMMTLASVGTVAAAELAYGREVRTVTYHVKGFTCVTCAVGLETLLRACKGVKTVKAT